MPSKAFDVFDRYTVNEIRTLVEIFSERNDQRGPNTAYGLLHGGLVILVSGWETYCEDVSKETVGKLVGRKNLTFDALPASTRRAILKYAYQENFHNADPLDTRLAKLPDKGWQNILYEMVEHYLQDFNTPKFKKGEGKKNLKKLFSLFLSTDVEEVIQKLTGKNNLGEKIDQLIEIRGTIAHRGKLEKEDKFFAKDLEDYLNIFHVVCAAIDAIIQQEFGLRYGSPVPWRATNTITKHLPHYDNIGALIEHYVAQDQKDEKNAE